MSTALLLIDEMGYDPMNREEASPFFRLDSHRYGRGAMIINTNKTVRGLLELLAGDEVLATAIFDLLLRRACREHQGPKLPSARPKSLTEKLTITPRILNHPGIAGGIFV